MEKISIYFSVLSKKCPIPNCSPSKGMEGL